MSVEKIESLARELDGRVESCEDFNPNVGEWAHLETRGRLRGYRIAARMSASRVEIEVKGFDTGVSFSANQVDLICLLDRPLTRPPEGLSCGVFVGATSGQATTRWLEAPENTAMVSSFHLTAGESLQVYRNAVVLIGSPTRATRETLQRLCDLADRLCHPHKAGLIDGLPFSVKNLPVDLQPLTPLIQRFAVGDDEIRSDLLAEASPAERRQLRERVTPLLPRINQFLDSFGDQPLSNEAMLVGYLAELVDELGRRKP